MQQSNPPQNGPRVFSSFLFLRRVSMSDLTTILPGFDVRPYLSLIPSLERHQVTTAELVTADAVLIAKRSRLPILNVKRLCAEVLNALQRDPAVPGDKSKKRIQDPAQQEARRGIRERVWENLGQTKAQRGRQREDSPLPPTQTQTLPPHQLRQLSQATPRQSTPRPTGQQRVKPHAQPHVQRHAELQARQDARRQSQEPPSLGHAPSRITVASLIAESRSITTLDPTLDHALAGGIPTGQVTEITGESGTGKTQFVHGLLLAVQLPPPYGLGKPALYITTEAPLSTRRLTQVSNSNPFLQSIDEAFKPSMDRIHTTATPFGDLEQQDFMISYQVPAAIERLGIGLVVIDSVTANFRAEFERTEGESQGRKMGRRAKALIRLGWHLRTLANRHNIAIVVVNQVADRFEREHSVAPASCSTYWPLDPSYSGPPPHPAVQRLLVSHPRPDSSPSEPPTQSSQTISSIDRNPYAYIPPPISGSGSRPRLGPPLPGENYSHQLRWMTGWGDERNQAYPPKTPALGLIWTNLVAMRLALIKQPIYSAPHEETSEQALERHGRSTVKANSWRRWVKIVFAGHVPPSAPGVGEPSQNDEGGGLKGAVEFEVTTGGLRALGSREADGE